MEQKWSVNFQKYMLPIKYKDRRRHFVLCTHETPISSYQALTTWRNHLVVCCHLSFNISILWVNHKGVTHLPSHTLDQRLWDLKDVLRVISSKTILLSRNLYKQEFVTQGSYLGWKKWQQIMFYYSICILCLWIHTV